MECSAIPSGGPWLYVSCKHCIGGHLELSLPPSQQNRSSFLGEKETQLSCCCWGRIPYDGWQHTQPLLIDGPVSTLALSGRCFTYRQFCAPAGQWWPMATCGSWASETWPAWLTTENCFVFSKFSWNNPRLLVTAVSDSTFLDTAGKQWVSFWQSVNFVHLLSACDWFGVVIGLMLLIVMVRIIPLDKQRKQAPRDKLFCQIFTMNSESGNLNPVSQFRSV